MAMRRNKSLITQAAEFAESVLPTLEQAVSAAKEVAVPLLSDAKEKAAPLLADGKALAAEKAASGRKRAAEAVAAATESAGSAESAGSVAVDDTTPRRRGGRLKKLLLVGGLAALGAVLYQKLRKDATSDNWQSAYVPTPAGPDEPPARAAGDLADDAAGAAPDEALADAAEAPHPVTTPDQPAEVVEVVDLADVPDSSDAPDSAADAAPAAEAPEAPAAQEPEAQEPGAHQA